MAKSRLKILKKMGNVFTVTSLFCEAVSIVNSGELMPSNIVDLVMGGLSLSGWGSLVAAGYYILDAAVYSYMGYGFGDMLDKKYGCCYQWQ